jgi:hypothetical protein
MARKTKEVLLKDILEKLKQRDYSINVLAGDGNWATTKNAVELLENLGLIEIKTVKNAKVCSLIKKDQASDEVDRGTVFKLPITKEEDNLFSCIFSDIKNKFMEINGREPKNTEAEKIASEVIFNLKLPVPIGWYLHGMVTTKLYDPYTDYEFIAPDNHEEIIDEIVKQIEKFSKFVYISDVIREQYRIHNNQMYLIKEELKKIIKPTIDLNSPSTKNTILKYMRHMLFNLPIKEDATALNKVVNRYVHAMDRFFLSDQNLNEYKADLYNIFESVWRLIATYNLLDSLSEYSRYDRKALFRYLGVPLESARAVAIENIKVLEDMCPPMKAIPELTVKTEAEELIRQSFIDMARDKE